MYPHFQAFRAQVNKTKGVDPFHGTLIALDPGETTGVAIFYVSQDGNIGLEQKQLKTWPFEEGYKEFRKLFRVLPKAVVHEAYKIYEWKTTAHGWSEVPTLQLIGCIKAVILFGNGYIQLYPTPVYVQTAQVAKNFCTDEKLKEWGMYNSGMRHARDAVRHGCYFLLFGPSNSS